MRERRWYTPINESAAADIVKQTQASGSPNVNTDLLAVNLNETFRCMETQWRLDLTSSRQSYKSLEAFASRMTKLERDLTSVALQENLTSGGHLAGASDEVYQSLGLEPVAPDSFWFDPRVELTVARLLTATRLMRCWAKAAVDEPQYSGGKFTAIEMLVGQGLPHFFEKHFGKRFGAGTAGDRSANGPGIRFVQACLAAASITRPDGKPYSVETIRTYWQNAQKHRYRRATDKSRKKT